METYYSPVPITVGVKKFLSLQTDSTLTMSPLESTIQIFLVASALGMPSFLRAMTRRWAMPMAAWEGAYGGCSDTRQMAAHHLSNALPRSSLPTPFPLLLEGPVKPLRHPNVGVQAAAVITIYLCCFLFLEPLNTSLSSCFSAHPYSPDGTYLTCALENKHVIGELVLGDSQSSQDPCHSDRGCACNRGH